MKKQKIQTKQNRSGIITVEAALVMPIIIIVLILLYCLAIIQYENVAVRVYAIRTANRAALNWNTIGGDGHNILKEDTKAVIYQNEIAETTGKSGKNAITSVNFKEHDPYCFFTELSHTGLKKKKNMQAYLEYQMSLVKNLETGISCTSSSEISSNGAIHIFNRYISVEVKNSYENPVFTLLERMGFPQQKNYVITAKAKLTNPTDFVRNISYIQELMRKK